MEIKLTEALLFSIIPTFIGTLITLYVTEKVKGLVKNGFDKKLELLKKEHKIDVTKFEAEINLLKTKENFKFTKLHEKRFNVLENLYKLLNKALFELNQYISPVKQLPKGVDFIDNEDELHKKFVDSHNKFANCFSDNKIYLNESIKLSIEKYLSEINDIYSDYSQNHLLRKMGGTFDLEINKKAITAYKKVPDKIIPIKEEIENSFKELLEQ